MYENAVTYDGMPCRPPTIIYIYYTAAVYNTPEYQVYVWYTRYIIYLEHSSSSINIISSVFTLTHRYNAVRSIPIPGGAIAESFELPGQNGQYNFQHFAGRTAESWKAFTYDIPGIIYSSKHSNTNILGLL